MSFRFQRITTVYAQVAERLLRENPEHRELSYGDLYERLVAMRFAQSDYYSVHMRRLGHQAETHFASIKPLQENWARAHGIRFGERSWFADIAVAQVGAFQPDVLLLDDLYAIDRPLRSRMIQACRRPPLLVGWRAAPTRDFSQFGDLNLLLSSIRELVEQFRSQGVNAHLLHHGFETSILDAVESLPQREVAFSFAGGLGAIHPERATLIEALLDRAPLEVWGEDRPVRWKDHLRWWLRKIGIPQKQSSRMRSLSLGYPGRIHPPVFGLDYYRLLARSKIVLNSHISCSSRDASNMRLFEATGMGACLLTDEKSNLAEMFEPDREIVTYSCVDECAANVEYLLENKEECAAIGAAAQRRTLKEHSFARRVETLERLLCENMTRRAAA